MRRGRGRRRRIVSLTGIETEEGQRGVSGAYHNRESKEGEELIVSQVINVPLFSSSPHPQIH